MRRAWAVIGSLIAAALITVVVVVVIDDGDGDAGTPKLEVIFGQDDALPDVLAAGTFYRAAFTVEWKGGVRGERDGILRVYASRLGADSEEAPKGEWPLICENEFDDVVSVARLPCQFETPTALGLFALQLEARSKIDDKVIGEGLYAHNIVDPETQESND